MNNLKNLTNEELLSLYNNLNNFVNGLLINKEKVENNDRKTSK